MGEDHSAAGRGIGGSVELLRVQRPKYVRLSSGQWTPLNAPRCLQLAPVSMPLRILNCCCLGFQ